MKAIDLPPVIDQLLRAGTALMISISGGKDSQAMLKALTQAYPERGWTGPIFAAHAHLGRMEWPQTIAEVRRQCQAERIELVIIERPQGDLLQMMIDRMHKVAGRDIPFWPSSASRYCTSGMKREQLDKILRWYEVVISAEGIRAEESPNQAKKPLIDLRAQICANRLKSRSIEEALAERKPGERVAINWRPIHSWTEEDVWREVGTSLEDVNRHRALARAGCQSAALEGWQSHPAYVTGLGNSRLSCALCCMADRHDLQNGAMFYPALHKTLVAMEEQSGFSFKNGFALSSLDAYYTEDTPLLADINHAYEIAEPGEMPVSVDWSGVTQAVLPFDGWC